ncbi:hypothetical protein B0H14DRAFT_2627372 [Mycena olivaceomarginata]|nr:hypothetical protein B0H14DRAFT_2627372 [Mycena olivaceomarginata]
MSASALVCTQNSDGSLKDASQIVFFNNVDDGHPISGPQSSTPHLLAPIFAPKAANNPSTAIPRKLPRVSNAAVSNDSGDSEAEGDTPDVENMFMVIDTELEAVNTRMTGTGWVHLFIWDPYPSINGKEVDSGLWGISI